MQSDQLNDQQYLEAMLNLVTMPEWDLFEETITAGMETHRIALEFAPSAVELHILQGKVAQCKHFLSFKRGIEAALEVAENE